MIENKDFVVCKVCGNHFRVLSGHIKDAHGIPSIKEYLNMFPYSITICSEAQKNRNKHREETHMRKYGVSHAMKVPSIAKKCNESGNRTRLKKYGVKHSSQIPGVSEKIVNSRLSKWVKKFGVPYHPEGRVRAIANTRKKVKEKYGVSNISQIKGVQDKKRQSWLCNYGVDNPMKSTEIMLKCFKSSSASPNNVERKVIKLNIDGVVFTGDGKIVIQAFNKKKIPDFIVAPFSKTKKVVEIFGEYYHGKKITLQDPEIHEREIKQLYANIGIDCLIIWSRELKNTQMVVEKIKNFISIKNNLRDYTPNILHRDDDIVQYI